MESATDLAGGEHDLFALAERNKKDGKSFPKLYMWCGLEDTLIDINRLFDKHLENLCVEHVYKESEGNHYWKWWDLHIQDGVKYVLNK